MLVTYQDSILANGQISVGIGLDFVNMTDEVADRSNSSIAAFPTSTLDPAVSPRHPFVDVDHPKRPSD